MPSKRIVYLDLAKVICTFLVVFAHLYSTHAPEQIFIYAFHMPFFFLVCGMFHKDLPLEDSLKINFRKILVPTIFYVVVYNLIISTIDTCISGDYKTINLPSLHDIWLYLIDFAYHLVKRGFGAVIWGNALLLGNGIIWFLIVLFYCKILEDLLSKKKTMLFIFLLLWVFVLWFRPKYFWLGQAVMSFPFYHLGKCCKQKIVAMSCGQGAPKYLRMGLCACMMVILPLLNGKVSIYGIVFGHLRFPLNVAVFYVGALAGTMFVLDCCSFLKKENRLITRVATSLISIVGFQRIFMKYYREYVGVDQPIWFSIIIAVAIMAACVVMHNVAVRYLPWVFGKTTPVAII